jgi:MFS family permease
MLLIFRVLQGAGGGGLQPMAQAIMADSFEPQKRGQAFALYGLVAVLAPSIGPTLGGWITDNFSWRWIFYINIPVGILAFILVTRLVEDPPWIKPDRSLLPQDGLLGLSFLTIAMGGCRSCSTRARRTTGSLPLHPHLRLPVRLRHGRPGLLGVEPQRPAHQPQAFQATRTSPSAACS